MQPDWVEQAKSKYILDPTYFGKGTTNIHRGITIVNFLKKNLNYFSKNSLQIVIIGIGSQNGPIICSYEAPFIAAYLESKNVDYEMILIDKNKQSLEDLMHQQSLVVPFAHLDENIYKQFYKELKGPYYNYHTAKKRKSAWRKYQTWIEEGTIDIFSPRHDIKVEKGYGIHYKIGLEVANLPAGFIKRRNEGKIQAIIGDIATVKLPKIKDLVTTTNILYHLDEPSQKLAMWNISQAMQEGSLIYITDCLKHFTPILKKFGGWISEEELNDMNFNCPKFIKNSTHFILQKQ